jgi:hypothetical protein
MKALRRKMRQMRKKRRLKPKMKIGPVESDGTIKVNFNQPMMNPSMIN